MSRVDWRAEIEAATTDYVTAVGSGASLPVETRVAAARRFRGRIARFTMGGGSALDALEAVLRRPDDLTSHDFREAWRPAACAHLLSEIGSEDAAQRLVAAWGRVGKAGAYIDTRHFARLGRARPLVWDSAVLPDFHQGGFARALFRQRPAEAEAQIAAWLAAKQGLLLTEAMKGISSWGGHDLLRRLLDSPPLEPDPAIPSDIFDDVRPYAAFWLALAGDAGALDALVAFARAKRSGLASAAVVALGRLAHPAGVAPTIALLRRARSNDALLHAINVASDYGTPPLAAARLDVVDRTMRHERSEVADEALRTLTEVLGIEIDFEQHPDAEPGVSTPAGRAHAVAFFRAALSRFDPSLRYHQGRPITLAILVEELCSPHAGPCDRGGHQLRAITGDDLGYDPDDDLILNLPAIDAWQARAADPAPLRPGGWAFRGEELAPPGLLH